MRYIIYFLLLIFSCSLSGCMSAGFHGSANATEVELTQNNYRVIAKSVRGEAEVDYILGFSYGVGIYTNSIALIPLKKQRLLHTQAFDQLWNDFEARVGNVENRSLGLVNIRYDTQFLNLIVYTKSKLIIVADVVEFQ